MDNIYNIDFVSPHFDYTEIRSDMNYCYAVEPKIYSYSNNYIETILAFIEKLVSDTDKTDHEFLIASETSLSDWLRREEDEAWAHL